MIAILADICYGVESSTEEKYMSGLWSKDYTLFDCLQGLESVAAGGSLPDERILALAKLFQREIGDGNSLEDLLKTKLWAVTLAFYKLEWFYEQKDNIKDVNDLMPFLRVDIKNLVCLGTLGVAYGDLGRAQRFCLFLNKWDRDSEHAPKYPAIVAA